MNKHLEPVFKVLLPRLERAGIDYWVYGGISIAAYAGKFVRNNDDVDIFVKEADFQKAESILNGVCELNNFKLIPRIPREKTGRPKLEIIINGKELLSVVPAYLRSSTVKFKFGRIIDEYSLQILEKVERNINDYKFYTPPDEYIKKFLLNHLMARKDKINRPKIRIDIEVVFTAEEQSKYSLV